MNIEKPKVSSDRSNISSSSIPEDLEEFLKQKVHCKVCTISIDAPRTQEGNGEGDLTTNTTSISIPPSSFDQSEDLNTASTDSDLLETLAKKYSTGGQPTGSGKERKQPAFWLKSLPTTSKQQPLKESDGNIRSLQTVQFEQRQLRQDSPDRGLNDIPTADQSFSSTTIKDLNFALDDTDEEKEEFFRKMESKLPDYEKLNQDLAEDSVDFGSLPVKMKLSELNTNENHSTAVAKVNSSATDQEEWDSIHSNIDYIETSHVFSESDISFDLRRQQENRKNEKTSSNDSLTEKSREDINEFKSQVVENSSPSKALQSPSIFTKRRQSTRITPKSATKSSSSSTKISAADISEISMSPSNSSKSVVQSASARKISRSFPAKKKSESAPVSEPDQLMRELDFLQKLLDKEQETSRSLRQKLELIESENSRLVGENTIITAELDDLKRNPSSRQALADRQLKKEQETETSFDSSKKQLEEQDRLIRGYQAENERLTAAIREQKDTLIKLEEKFGEERQRLKDEISELHTRVYEFDGRSSRQSRLQEDEFRTQLDEVHKKTRECEAELRTEITELRSIIKKLETGEKVNANVIPERVEQQFRERETELKMQLAELEGIVRKYQASAASNDETPNKSPETAASEQEAHLKSRINDLESMVQKLEKANEDREYTEEQVSDIRKEYEQQIRSLKTNLDSLKKQSTKEANALEEQTKQKESLIADLRRKLEETKTSSGSKLSLRPSIGKKKNKIDQKIVSQSANTEAIPKSNKGSFVELKMSDAASSTEPLLKSSDQDVEYYRKKMETLSKDFEAERNSLTAEIHRLQTSIDQYKINEAQTKPVDTAADTLNEIIGQLRGELSTKKFEMERMQREAQTAQSRIESLTQDTLIKMQKISQLEDDSAKMGLELKSAHATLNLLQQSSSISEERLAKLQSEIRDLTAKLNETQQKLFTSETVRETLHEQFKLLLKQAQATTVETALAHHEHTIMKIRDEAQRWAESEAKTAVSSIQHQLITKDTLITSLREQVDTLTIDLQQHRDRMFRLERQLDDSPRYSRASAEREGKLAQEISDLRDRNCRATVENERLTKELVQIRSALTPTAVQYHELRLQLATVEERLKKREKTLQDSIEEYQSKKYKESDHDQYKRLLRQKDQQIIVFRKEVDELVRELSNLSMINKLQ